MNTYTPDSNAPGSLVQGDLFSLAPRPAAICVDDSHWLREQLEASIKRLVRTVNTLVYTRNPVAIAVAAQQCDQVQHMVYEFQKNLEHTSAIAGVCAVDELLLVETHQLLADARRLVSVPLRPVWRDDNVVELQPDYGDLTDAAFERMLASSDIPQLLSSNDEFAPVDTYADTFWDESCTSAGSGKAQPAARERPKLTLVYSRDARGSHSSSDCSKDNSDDSH